MGKPYTSELKALPSVYRWAVEENVDRLVEAIECSSTLPMIATGSGGAFTAAHLASCLHQKYSRNQRKNWNSKFGAITEYTDTGCIRLSGFVGHSSLAPVQDWLQTGAARLCGC